METSFEFMIPDAVFWNEYNNLWKNSQYHSSFQAPLFLQFLVSQVSEPVAVLKGYRDGKLMGLTIFYKKAGVFHFLSDMKTDHNFFILRNDISREEMKQYFVKFLDEIEKRKWTFRLNNQPSWANFIDIFKEALAESSLFSKIVPYNPCLVLEAETPEALFKATNKQKLRQKFNRLQEKGDIRFESFLGTEDLDQWLEEFYEIHIRRWAPTVTPSSYSDRERRLFYKSCMLAWIQEEILVRFSIRLNKRRIAFVTALLENGYLVHHTTTFDPDYEKQSPGLIIINLIGKWMADRNMTKMEFGDGGEAYKYQFTRHEFPLLTIFISSKRNLPFILKTRLINFVRKNNKIRNYYNAWIRPAMIRLKILKKR